MSNITSKILLSLGSVVIGGALGVGGTMYYNHINAPTEVNIIGESGLSTTKQQESYSFGVMIGPQLVNTLKVSNMDVEDESFLQGIIDTIKKQKLKIVEEDVVQNFENMQKSASKATVTKLEEKALSNQDTLFANSDVPSVGSGQITLVEFFDYNCPHCRTLNTTLSELVKNNENIKLIYRPIWLGSKSSKTAALAVLAANRQDKFKELHTALMQEQSEITEEVVNKIVKKLKLNQKKFDKDLKEVELQAQQNVKTFMELGLRGVPSVFVAKLDENNKVTDKNLKFLTGVDPEALNNSIKELTN